jgi:dihydrofolate synthase/folylpolyglutamate synthase
VTLSYADALAELSARGRFGIRLGLARIRAILRDLGDPQRDLRGALVAGTNGKGSVLALSSAALRAAGYRVGETPKPHLVSYRERLQVDGHPIEPEAFARLVAAVLPSADRVAGRLGPATEFELLTAVVFAWFAEAAIDVALVEVGLGGRLDATHAWDGGVAVVTNVTLDHMDRLGSTVTQIAREKAAIIERGDLAVTGADGDALQVVASRARRVGVPLIEVAPPAVLEIDRDGIVVELPRLGATRVGLRGRHQAANAAVAQATLDALERAGIATVPDEARRRGFADARWPGRLELLEVAVNGATVEVLLDGAHNPAGADALATALDDLRPHLAGGRERSPSPVTLVMGTMADKDVDGMIRALAGSASLTGARVIATAPSGGRALPADGLASRWRALAPGVRVEVAAAPVDALAAAMGSAASGGGPVVVAGSLYLVGEARARLAPDPGLVDPVAPDPAGDAGRRAGAATMDGTAASADAGGTRAEAAGGGPSHPSGGRR